MKRAPILVLVLAVGLLAVGALSGSPAPAPSATPQAGPTTAISAAQARVASRPDDAETWARLGMAYVQQAKVTGDPSFYAKAEGAVATSLAIEGNYLGYAGQAALKNAVHDFRGAKAAAERGIRLNAFSSTLYGALGDALTQLGRYDEAAAAIDRMNQLLPGVPAFTRASYVFELRGDVPAARSALERALKASTTSADKAFSRYYLGELDLYYGDGARKALAQFDLGLTEDPADAMLRAGRARALAALGRTEEAVAAYQAVVAARPEPQFVLELAELQESLGDPAARQSYQLFRVQEKLYAAGGVALEAESTLFEADHGSPAAALAQAAAGWRVRPFVEMADAYAWALYANKRYAEAFSWSSKAFASGWKTAPALFHRGMIHKALGHDAAAKADLAEALRLDPFFNALKAPRAKAVLAGLQQHR